MGLHHFYCSVSGGRYFLDREEFRSTVTEIWDDDDDIVAEDESGNSKDVIASPKVLQLSDVIWNGLLYSQEDVDASSNFVLLCLYERAGDGTVTFPDLEDSSTLIPINTIIYRLPAAKETEQLNVTEIFHVTPEGDPDYGQFRTKGYQFNMYSHTTVIIMYTAYLIMKQASPRLTPHIIYQLVLHPNLDTVVKGIDYGPVEDQLGYWHRMLTQEGKTDEEILHDAWRGPGNMWVFVRPDRFPIAETLAAKPLLVISRYSGVETTTLDALPLDILIHICQWLPVKSLHMILCTNRRLRGEILPHADMIAYRQIITHEPHLLPAGPFKFDLDEKRGRDEIDWWDAEWAKSGITKENLTLKKPWFLYRMECSKSMSMWNRRRIWGIAKQLEKLAIDEELLLEDTVCGM